MNDFGRPTLAGRPDPSRRSDPNGPVTCATCGCRLTEAQGLEGTAWRHFQLVPDQDARGCRPRCLEDLHRRDGTILSARHLETLLADAGIIPTPGSDEAAAA